MIEQANLMIRYEENRFAELNNSLALCHDAVFKNRQTRSMTADDWHQMLSLKTSHLFLALLNDDLIGFVLYQIVGCDADIITLGIHPEFRGHKYGSILLRESMQFIFKMKVVLVLIV